MEYQSARTPWKHQTETLEALAGRKFFALFLGMRTGKTKIILDDFGRLELAGDVEDLVVIAPAGAYKTWVTAIEEHASKDLKKRLDVFVWESGRNGRRDKERRADFVDQTDKPRALIMNVEALSSVEEARKIVMEIVSQRKSMIVVDESTVIKNIDSNRGNFIVNKLGPKASYRRILSGLPCPRSPLDVFAQFQFLEKGCLGHENFITFKSRYADEQKICVLPTPVLRSRLKRYVGNSIQVNGIGEVGVEDMNRSGVLAELDRRRIYYQSIPTIKGYRNEEELRDKIAPLSFRRTLDQCYDLPPKMYSMREVEMTKEQKRIYQDIKDKATSQLNEMDHVTALSVITRILRCHQVLCGHVRDEEGKFHEVPEKRTKALLELLEDYDGHKAVVWCSYDPDVRKVSLALRKEFGEDSVARFWGGNSKEREADEIRFKTDDKCRFMVATPDSGGKGRAWDIADLVVYYSNTDNLEHRDQSEERTQANMKTRSVGYVDLMIPGTVDEKIVKSLRRKIDMAAVITGDDWRQWLV
jgi:SNF2 family DNA or RNA helicase